MLVTDRRRATARLLAPVLLLAPTLLLALPVTASAGGATISVTPSTGLTDGSVVSVSGSGFSGAGAITQCSTAAGQPTISVAGNAVPVSCSNPLSKLVSFSGGALAATSFTVHTGTVGPPSTGTDSAGHDAATDAALYPCPPTTAQQAAGATCTVTVGDSAADAASQVLGFAGGSTPSPSATPTHSASTSAPTSTPAITVSPSSGLKNAQSVTVSGTGFPHNDSLAVIECSPLATTDPANAQSYCDVAKVSLSAQTDAQGSFTTTFVVYTGTIGSSSKAVCPPVTGSCFITASEPSPTSTVHAQANIAFGTAAAASPTPTKAATTSTAPTQQATPTTTATTAVSGEHTTTSPADPALPFTGSKWPLWVLVAAGAFLLDVGYLSVSATWRRRPRPSP